MVAGGNLVKKAAEGSAGVVAGWWPWKWFRYEKVHEQQYML